jgi:N-acyl-L-homoserine lactone synthetase
VNSFSKGIRDMDDQTYLTTLDKLAPRLITMNESLSFRAAQTQAEREATYRLRYQEVIERGWSKPEDHPDHMEHDEDDIHASHITAWDDQTLAGCARLVFPSSERLLPVETAFNIIIEPAHQVVYLSRMLIAPAYRGKGQHSLLLGLLAMSWQEVRAKGFHHLCGVFSEAVMPTFEKVGIQMVLLGKPQDFAGEIRRACYIDMCRTAQALSKHFL